MGLLVIALFISFGLLYSYLSDFNLILKNNNCNQKLTSAFEKEIEAYHNYTSLKNDTNKIAYYNACEEMAKALNNLPNKVEDISKERYLITTAIKNSYDSYERQKNHVLLIERGSEAFIKELYESLDMQEYISGYIQNLSKITLQENDEFYNHKLYLFNKVPYILVLLGLFSLNFIVIVGYSIAVLVLRPVMKLADMAGRITKKEYDTPDVEVENEDEIGQLVQAFNIMKDSTLKAINTLKEKHEVENQLHREEVKRMSMEKLVDTMKMRMLQNQIKPHFLFNTLNVISGMARIEGAETSREMTMSLSKLLRYNLKMDKPLIALKNEISIIKDYFYIQEKRFGPRIKLHLQVEADEENIMVPTFTLQPLVENAIIHGLSPKEEGGKVYIKILDLKEELYMEVSDSGVGIKEEKLQDIRREVSTEEGNHLGIGVLNVFQRCKTLFPGSTFEIYSKENEGTKLVIKLKQEVNLG